MSESQFVAMFTVVAASSMRLSLRPKKELSIQQLLQWIGYVLCDVSCFVRLQNGSHDLVTSQDTWTVVVIGKGKGKGRPRTGHEGPEGE